MTQKAYFFIRKQITARGKNAGKIQRHRIGVIALSYDDNLLEVSGSFCSVADRFNPKVAVDMAFGRLNSKKDHVCTLSVDKIYDSTFTDVINQLGFGRTRRHFGILDKHVTYGDGSVIDVEAYNRIFKSVVNDVTGISGSL